MVARPYFLDGAEDVLAAVLRGGKLLERSAQGPEFRPDLGATKQLGQSIHMRGQNVFANVGREVVVTDELMHSRKDCSRSGDQRVA